MVHPSDQIFKMLLRPGIFRSMCDEDGVRSWLSSSQHHLHDCVGELKLDADQIPLRVTSMGSSPNFRNGWRSFGSPVVTICKIQRRKGGIRGKPQIQEFTLDSEDGTVEALAYWDARI